ncbi:hypothetical protein M5D96_005587 [Drosophila gunungcola]|uniref:Uncharacterized protein n=1 Tax=Drosophila gunungcola TaxID=103775 RepID=A0A9Q0BRL1_9MUSC|nr:hypothetical protein M5D96_005587 [Drosophila gunungcola]
MFADQISDEDEHEDGDEDEDESRIQNPVPRIHNQESTSARCAIGTATSASLLCTILNRWRIWISIGRPSSAYYNCRNNK